MALSTGKLLDLARNDIAHSEAHKFRGMATIALIVLNNTHWSDVPKDHKTLRAELLAFGESVGIPGPTWQAYAKGMDVMCDKFNTHLKGREFSIGLDGEGNPTMVEFDEIRSHSEEEAVELVTALFVTNGVSSGGQIRDWAKQEGFAPYDAEKVKAERKAALASTKATKMSGALALLLAHKGNDTSSLKLDAAKGEEARLASIVAALASLSSAERLMIQADLSSMLENDAKVAEEAEAAIANVEEETMPVLDDTVEETASPNKRRAKAARLAKAA